MVSELGLVGGHGFEPPLCNLNICAPCVYLKVHNGLRCIGLFVSPRAGMRSHVREGVEGMLFILNPNPTSLSFLKSW